MSPVRHIGPSTARLSSRHERWVLGISLALLISGALWLVFHHFVTVQGDFGESRHPMESWWLRLHGAAAMVFLVVLGTLLPVHIDRAWRSRKIHRTGVVVICIVIALILTGYGLYYAGSEELRPWISVSHWGIGLIGVPALAQHVLVGKRKTGKLKPTARKQHRQPTGPRTAEAGIPDRGPRN